MLNALEILAVSKMVKKDVVAEARKNVAVGENQEVNFLMRVSGSLNVGEDFEKKQVNKVDWIGLTALALSKLNGVTVDSLVKEYLEMDKVDVKEVKASAQAKIDEIKGKTLQPTNGVVTTQLSFDRVEEAN